MRLSNSTGVMSRHEADPGGQRADCYHLLLPRLNGTTFSVNAKHMTNIYVRILIIYKVFANSI